MSTAFITATPILSRTSFTSVRTNRSPVHISPIRTSVMSLETEEKSKVSLRKDSLLRTQVDRGVKQSSEYRGPQGFTPYAERVNGRMAMIGFFIGLVTELVSGKPIGQQMLIMFSPLVHAVQAILN